MSINVVYTFTNKCLSHPNGFNSGCLECSKTIRQIHIARLSLVLAARDSNVGISIIDDEVLTPPTYTWREDIKLHETDNP